MVRKQIIILGLLLVISCLSACGNNKEQIKDVHEHAWKAATCSEPRTCTICGLTEGEALGHEFMEATCLAPKTCKVCLATVGEKNNKHEWKNATCMTPKTCDVCGLTEGDISQDHQWEAATCSTPKMCKVCKLTHGEKLEHEWIEATCETPKTCKLCNKTEGEADGHKWVEATYETPKTCSVCFKTEGSKLVREDLTCRTALPKEVYVEITDGSYVGVKISNLKWEKRYVAGDVDFEISFDEEIIGIDDPDLPGHRFLIKIQIYDSQGYIVDEVEVSNPTEYQIGDKFKVSTFSMFDEDDEYFEIEFLPVVY